MIKQEKKKEIMKNHLLKMLELNSKMSNITLKVVKMIKNKKSSEPKN